jgi:hypothetical protein
MTVKTPTSTKLEVSAPAPLATTAAAQQVVAAPPEIKVAPLEQKWMRFLAGGLASGTAEIFTLPIDCTKVRLQAQRSGPVSMATPSGGQQYNGMFDAARKIMAEEGPGALWKGATPALVRQVSYTSICMVLYEPLRDLFGANNGSRNEVPFINKFLAGGFAGAISISMANPYVSNSLSTHVDGGLTFGCLCVHGTAAST